MSFSNAISSMFGSAKSHSSSSTAAANRRTSAPSGGSAAAANSASSPGSLLGTIAADSPLSSPSALVAPDSLLTPYGHLSREVRPIDWYYFTVQISGFFLLLSYCDSRMSR